MAGDLTPSWWSRRPLLEPSSRSTSGRRDLDCEWSFVYCFSKRGPSHLSQVPLRPGPQCPIVPAKSPGFRPDLCNTFLPNSDPSVRFSSAHKGILSYCPRFRRDFSLSKSCENSQWQQRSKPANNITEHIFVG